MDIGFWGSERWESETVGWEQLDLRFLQIEHLIGRTAAFEVYKRTSHTTSHTTRIGPQL